MKLDPVVRGIVAGLAKGLYDFEVEGLEHVPDRGPCIVVANHRSYIDPFILGYALRSRTRFVTTIRVYRSAFTRWFCQQLGSIPTRHAGGGDVRAVRGVLRALRDGEIVGLFPEGERSWDGGPLPLLTGAVRLMARADVPIVPVSLIGTYEAWPRWAAYPRLAPTRAVFGPPIAAGTRDRETLGHRIERSIHGPVLSRPPVEARAVALARGLHHLLWWCPACQAVDGLREASGDTLRCASCAAEFRLDARYALTRSAPDTGRRPRSRPLHGWARETPPLLEPQEPLPRDRDWLEPGEAIYVRGEAMLDRGREPHLEGVGVGEVVLTDRRVRFGSPRHDLELATRELGTAAAEGPKSLRIGKRRSVWLIRFREESSVKWESYLKAIRDVRMRGSEQASA